MPTVLLLILLILSTSLIPFSAGADDSPTPWSFHSTSHHSLAFRITPHDPGADIVFSASVFSEFPNSSDGMVAVWITTDDDRFLAGLFMQQGQFLAEPKVSVSSAVLDYESPRLLPGGPLPFSPSAGYYDATIPARLFEESVTVVVASPSDQTELQARVEVPGGAVVEHAAQRDNVHLVTRDAFNGGLRAALPGAAVTHGTHTISVKGQLFAALEPTGPLSENVGRVGFDAPNGCAFRKAFIEFVIAHRTLDCPTDETVPAAHGSARKLEVLGSGQSGEWAFPVTTAGVNGGGTGLLLLWADINWDAESSGSTT